ncbi:GNAT family N-acetyltransferase [Prescottella equi]|uniref:GNAT family N-acetyltransferase n=1 Tax=Rhodococcus hoagii TaxID=43767 RepID=UPI003557E256
MALKLVTHRCDSAKTKRSLPPFDRAVRYAKEGWWDGGRLLRDPWYVQVLEDDVEVGRVALDDYPPELDPEYRGAPRLGRERLKIQFIAVAEMERGRGIGPRVVRALVEEHADRRFFAYSEGADRFWASLGWKRFATPDGLRAPLFIQPVRRAFDQRE